MNRTCIVDLVAGVVVNVIEYDDPTTGVPPGFDDGFVAVPSSHAQIGWEFDGSDLHPPASAESAGEAKARLSALVKIERDRRTREGGYLVEHNGATYWFHSDAFSLIQQQGLILAAMAVQAGGGDMDAPLIPIPWQTLGGAGAPMTAALALKLLPASMTQQGAIFAHAKSLSAAVEAAADPTTVDVAAGWPAVFGEAA